MAKIAILGAGVVGSAYAVLLATAGHEVSLIARGQRYDELCTHGLHVDLDGDVLSPPVAVIESLSETDHDILIVAVRGDQLMESLHDVLASRAETILVFANPLAKRAEVEQALGMSRLVWCFSGIGGGLNAHIVKAHRVSQQPTIVQWGGARSESAANLLACTDERLRREPSMAEWLDTHTLFVAAMAATVLTQRLDTYRERWCSARQLVRAMRQAFAVREWRGGLITPTNLRIIFGKVPTPIAELYWAVQFTRPVVTVSIAPHARTTRDTEQRAVARYALTLVDDTANDYLTLVGPLVQDSRV